MYYKTRVLFISVIDQFFITYTYISFLLVLLMSAILTPTIYQLYLYQ